MNMTSHHLDGTVPVAKLMKAQRLELQFKNLEISCNQQWGLHDVNASHQTHNAQ